MAAAGEQGMHAAAKARAAGLSEYEIDRIQRAAENRAALLAAVRPLAETTAPGLCDRPAMLFLPPPPLPPSCDGGAACDRPALLQWAREARAQALAAARLVCDPHRDQGGSVGSTAWQDEVGPLPARSMFVLGLRDVRVRVTARRNIASDDRRRTWRA